MNNILTHNIKKYFFCWRSHLSNDDIISVFVNMYVAFCDGPPPGLMVWILEVRSAKE